MSNRYPVNNLYPTIQGEGCQTGIPMVILRLQGCDVGCPWCDTKETWALDPADERESLEQAIGVNALYVQLSGSEVNREIVTRYPTFKWVMVTGGEPARHDLRKLVTALHDGGFRVALETSGTEIGYVGAAFDWICVSPKIGMPGGRAFLPEVLEDADEIKMVIGKEADIRKLEDLLSQAALKPGCTICLQPVSLSPKATELCIHTVQERAWRLSIQTHKLIDLP